FPPWLVLSSVPPHAATIAAPMSDHRNKGVCSALMADRFWASNERCGERPQNALPANRFYRFVAATDTWIHYLRPLPFGRSSASQLEARTARGHSTSVTSAVDNSAPKKIPQLTSGLKTPRISTRCAQVIQHRSAAVAREQDARNRWSHKHARR